MTPTLRRKLEALAERREELERLLSDPTVVGDNDRFRALSREFSQLEPVATALADEARAKADLAAAEAMREDPDLRELADEEITAAQQRLQQLDEELALLLVPRDPRDDGNLFLEVRAGTGGDEAAIFAGDLFRMYARYAERQGWKVEIESDNPGEHGGYKEVVARVVGRGAFSRLKFESGTHRVQRVPATESQGRIHTSAATVAIIPEADDVEDVVINPADLRVDTYRSSGAGGQHVNKTESAIRITHLPTGVVVECQTERSQHANRDKAMKRLKAQLLDAERQRQDAAQAESRRLQVGSGDRSQRIRTYNFPQGRITDHRVEGLTLYDLPNILAGDLDPLLQRQADCISTMTYNEYGQVLDAGVSEDELVTFKYEDMGVATLEDGIYVLEENLEDPAFKEKMVKFVRASMKGWKYAEENPDEAAEIVLEYDETGAQTEAHQKRMMGEIAKLTAGSNGALDEGDFQRTVDTLLAGGSDPVITAQPEGAWTSEITDAALN